MAMIDKIRKRKELLLIMIGLGMLGFLIPFDSMMALFGKGGPSTITVASIEGKDITLDEYQRELQKRRTILNYGSDDALENAVWNDMIENIVLSDDYEELGLYIGKDEYDDIRFGENTSSFVNSVFYGGAPTNEAKQNLQTTFSNWYNGTLPDRQMWEAYKDIITQKRKKEKYDALVAAGGYMNNIDAKADDVYKNRKVSFDFVVKKYTEIPDSLITYDESDVKAYFEKHKNEEQYKQKTSRAIEYITFNVVPTAEDSAQIESDLAAQIQSFKETKNDSIFVMNQSDNGLYNTVKYREGDIKGDIDSLLFSANEGDVVGPYFNRANYKISKVVSKGNVPEVQARHILLQGGEDEMEYLKEKADSIKKVIKRNNNFAEMATDFSKDPGSAAKGGDLGWFGKGKMVPPFEEACFNGNVGDMPIVQSQFGVHLIEITDKRDVEELTLANVQRQVNPSPSTLEAEYRKANDWVINHSTEESFRAAADTMGVKEALNIQPNARTISGLANSFSVVDWAYKAEVGEISSPLLAGNTYVVAILNNKTKEGVPNFAAVKEQMEEEVKKEKKAELYAKIMAEGNNLDEVATAAGKTVMSARDISMSSTSIPGGGSNEFEVIGLAMRLSEDEMSYPIKGDGGVYVISPSSPKSEVTPKEDYSADAKTLTTRVQNRAKGGLGVFNALKKEADIEDNRRQF